MAGPLPGWTGTMRGGPAYCKYFGALLQMKTVPSGDEGEPPSQPVGLILESRARTDVEQSAIPLHDVEADARLQLPQVDRTQVHRARVALAEVVRAVHQAMKVDAVLDAEHMG